MINAAAFKESILCAYAALQADIQAINDLNVFPVPDGDTGTNMGLTMEKAAMELRKNDFPTVSAAADCVASALLRGARGNSGVILSLLFRGISRKLKGLHEADAKSFAAALHDGVEAAYKAVMKPAEGTILTVSRLAAEAAVKTAEKDAGLEKTFEAAIKAGDEALADTINLNPVLKKAGVVDAGGMGFMVILKAMFASLKGEVFARLDQIRIEEVVSDDSGNGYDPRENITFAFDTVYIVRKKTPDIDLEPLRAYLDSIGDSLVISDDDEIFKVHVHTDTPGDALNESQKYGTLEVAKIENMVIQADQNAAGEKVISTEILEDVAKELETKEAEPEYAEPEKQFGAVVVAAGPGMQKLFRELGADRVVTGGQTMNPSTDDILREINRTPAETVFVLPNNKNIIMAAEQVAALSTRKVIVLPTRTIPQGVTALIHYNPDLSVEENHLEMSRSLDTVDTAQVTFAARDSVVDGLKIKEGQMLGMENGAITVVEDSALTAAFKITRHLCNRKTTMVTIFYGEGATEEEATELEGMIRDKFKDLETAVIPGGQPVYSYIISVE